MRSRVLAVLLALAPAAAHAQQATLPFDFSSVVFGNFQMRTDSQAKFTTGGEPTSRFDVARAYLTFRFPAGERASVRITTDVFQQQNPAAAAFYGGWAIRLKYGYLQYDATRSLFGVKDLAAVARIGMLHTVVIEHIETFWPRWLGNTAVETNGFFSSADVGAATLVTLPKRRGEFYATVTNGPGYANNENDRFKDFAGRFSLTPFGNDSGILRTFTITPWYYKGWSASGYTQATPPVSDGLQRDRMGVFVGLRDRRITVGAELDQRVEDVETTVAPAPRGPVNERTSQLVSAFAIVRPIELFDSSRRSRLSLIGRFDRFRINSDADPYSELAIAGLIWDVNSKVQVALDYQGSTPRENPAGVPVRSWFLHWVANF